MILLDHVVEIFRLDGCDLYHRAKPFQDLGDRFDARCIRTVLVDDDPLWDPVVGQSLCEKDFLAEAVSRCSESMKSRV